MKMSFEPCLILGMNGVTASLSLRFVRLRTTALPSFLPTEKQILTSSPYRGA